LFITPTEKHDELTHFGHQLYLNCTHLSLEGNLRSSSSEFTLLLSRIRDKKVTEADIAVLESRLEDNLTEEEKEKFSESLHLFGETRLVDMYNNYYIMQKNANMVYIPAILSTDCSTCIDNTPGLFAGIGFKCMITNNLSTKLGLVNGQTCFIENLVYKTSTTDIPDFLVIRIEGGKYRGRGLNNSSNLVSIFPIKTFEYCKHRSESYTVTKIPLILNYATTVHKVSFHNR